MDWIPSSPPGLQFNCLDHGSLPLGSRNGTFVNEQKIGKRDKDMTAEQGAALTFEEHALKDGDEIRLGQTIFRVSVFVPPVCAKCEVEAPERQEAGICLCPDCQRKKTSSWVRPVAASQAAVCARCGRDVSEEIGAGRQGEFICAACTADPFQVVKNLVQMARSGRQELLAIQGYKVLKELGKGGMGAVYLARHEKAGEQVALKVMLPQVALNKRAKQMFLREIETTRALKHPNVVELCNLGCSDSTFFFTLEYCDGGSVDQLLKKRGGPLSVSEACEIVLQVLAGLEYAHQVQFDVSLPDGGVQQACGLVHRDLKPQNIFLSGSGSNRVVKVGDFGLAKAFDLAGLSGQSCTGAAAGTPVFMPRQQVVNFKYARPDVDVWTAAASLYFLLTGVVPRDFTKGQDKWQVVPQSSAVPIRRRDPKVPARLAEVIDLALVDDPDIHSKTATEFRQALEGVL